MNLVYLFGLLLGMVAALLMNVGKGVQKQKVHVFLQGRKMFFRPHRRDLIIWFFGMGMTGSAVLPFSLGLKFSGSPSAISAMTGIGLIGLTVYALKVIGEKISKSEMIGVALVVIGTSLLGYLGAENPAIARDFMGAAMIKIVIGLIILAAIACGLALLYRKMHGIVFGLTAGAWIGLALILADAALVRADGSFFRQLLNPYPYVGMVFATLALATTQVGFLRGRAMEVIPAINSATIITPLILEGLIYRKFPETANILLIIVILIGVLLLSTGAAAKVSE